MPTVTVAAAHFFASWPPPSLFYLVRSNVFDPRAASAPNTKSGKKSVSTNTDETSEITGIFTNAFNSLMNVSTLITESAQYIDI